MLLPILINLGFAAGDVVTPTQPIGGSDGHNWNEETQRNKRIKMWAKDDEDLLTIIKIFLQCQ